MEIFVSTWQPWATARWPQKKSIKEQVDLALALGVDAISMKGTNGGIIWGAKENMSFLYAANSNDALEKEVKAQGMKVALWCWVDCEYPAPQARAIQEAVARWNPITVKLDVEGDKAKANAFNTGAFLRSMGPLKRHDGSRVRVYLQSYRRPDLHREIAWKSWLTYKDPSGVYYLDGIAPQAYYAGTQDSVADYTRMVKAYRSLERDFGRVFDWHVTLPTYREYGWQPTPESLLDGIAYLREELKERLVGLDYWRLGCLLEEGFKDILVALMSLDFGDEEPTPESVPEPTPEPKIVDVLTPPGVEIRVAEKME